MLKLSIIIPIYNVEEYLAECLESILKQDRDTIEVLMVDDASSDHSLGIAKLYLQRFKNAKLIQHTQNKGLGPTRNSALKVASGDYIMMVDSDDWISEKAIDLIIDCIAMGDFDLAQFACNKIYKDRIETNLYQSKQLGNSIPIDAAKSEILKLPCYVWLKIYRRSFVHTSNIQFENIYYEDIPWSTTLTLRAAKIILRPESIYNYRQRDGSIVNSQSSKHLDLLRAYDAMFANLKLLDLSWHHKAILYDAFIRASYYLFREREVRLGKSNTDVFIQVFTNIMQRHKPYPSSPKTIAMSIILSYQLTKHYLRNRKNQS